MKFSLTDCTLKIVICVIVKCSWKITWRHKALGQSLFALIYNLSIYYKPHSMLLLFKCIFLKLAIFTKYICLIQKVSTLYQSWISETSSFIWFFTSNFSATSIFIWCDVYAFLTPAPCVTVSLGEIWHSLTVFWKSEMSSFTLMLSRWKYIIGTWIMQGMSQRAEIIVRYLVRGSRWFGLMRYSQPDIERIQDLNIAVFPFQYLGNLLLIFLHVFTLFYHVT